MIQLRKNAFSETTINIEFIPGEVLSSLVDRTLLENGYDLDPKVIQHFQVLVNGYQVDKEYWAFVQVLASDTILIAPKISGGSGGQLFKQIALIAITVVASVYLSPAVGGGLYGALAVAAVSIGSSLALNSLIPPPGLGGLGGLGSSTSFEGSQMYTITSQQNSAKKFGFVPKVYGTHRIFPLIAANPYTEIEADPETGAPVQYYYAIYDFGFGPAIIDEIKIGDTSITDYDNAEYRLVDLNKPLISTGGWDDALYDNFEFYKGDVERDGSSVAINKNQSSPTAALDDYQVVRSASDKVEGNDQEITLNFVCPNGLIAYGTDGTKGKRTIELKIQFSKVGEDVWRAFNDITYVYSYDSTGGSDNVFKDKTATNYPITGDVATSEAYDKIMEYPYWGYSKPNNDRLQGYNSWGYVAGTRDIYLKAGDALVGQSIYFNGNFVGVVSSIHDSVSYPLYKRYRLASTIKKTITLFTRYEYENRTTSEIYYEYSSIGKFIIKVFSAGTATITGQTTVAKYATFKFKPKEIAQYKVRITRVKSSSTKTYQVQDALTLSNLSTRFDRVPIITDKRHVFLELRIRATNQLNGSIQNLSAVASSVLDVYDPDTLTWKKEVTSNPAWVYCDLLTGEINKKAVDKSRLHLPSILEWAEFCDEVPDAPPSQTFNSSRFRSNFVLDFDTTLQSLINNVCNASQASLNIIDGKYGVLLDVLKTIPVQIFTPRNSTAFTSSRNYSDLPHALTIKYVNPDKNWDVTEITVFDDGYDVNTATEFDELSTFACTDFEQAWRFGRYMIAQARLRRETISIEVDFEHIVCTRGDFVQVSQDVMMAGGTPARIKTISGSTVTIDDGIDTIGALDYGYVYRLADGTIGTSTLTVVDSDEFVLDGVIPAVGDLIIIGEVGKIVIDCLVKSIQPNSDLSATLILVEKADAIYSAESTDVLPAYDPKLSFNVNSELAKPNAVEDLVVLTNSWRVKGKNYEYYIGIDWEAPETGSAYDSFEVYVNNGRGYSLQTITKKTEFEYIVHSDDLDIEHGFKVLAVSSTGKKILLIEAEEVTATPLTKLNPPSSVEALYINITGETLTLEWQKIPDLDVKEYLIRYNPTAYGTWETSIPLLKVDGNTSSASTQGRTGTYLIKAIDLNDNESDNSAIALTSIPKLFDLNIVEQTNDFPDVEGELVNCTSDGTSLTLKTMIVGGVDTNTYYPEGFYYYKDFLDLGEIYTVRLQSLIQAEGYTIGDLMSNWSTLDAVSYLSNAGNADWDVETYYRTTDSFNVMSDWNFLSDIDPISEGDQDNWTVWKKFTIGDATGRIFQFRLRLISNLPSVTPRVFDGVIKSDMPDRFESYNDQIVPNTGLTIVYDPPFKGPGVSPNIQVSQDNASQGDYYILENKTLDGFKITFYDLNNVAVERQADLAIKGFGRKALAVI